MLALPKPNLTQLHLCSPLLQFSDEMFERLREAAEKQYTNIRLAQPYQHSIFNQEYLLSPDLFHRDEQLEVHRLLHTTPATVLAPSRSRAMALVLTAVPVRASNRS